MNITRLASAHIGIPADSFGPAPGALTQPPKFTRWYGKLFSAKTEHQMSRKDTAMTLELITTIGLIVVTFMLVVVSLVLAIVTLAVVGVEKEESEGLLEIIRRALVLVGDKCKGDNCPSKTTTATD